MYIYLQLQGENPLHILEDYIEIEKEDSEVEIYRNLLDASGPTPENFKLKSYKVKFVRD